jgi:hypothetical protein
MPGRHGGLFISHARGAWRPEHFRDNDAATNTWSGLRDFADCPAETSPRAKPISVDLTGNEPGLDFPALLSYATAYEGRPVWALNAM